MIIGAVFCPHPPALVPEVGARAASDLSELRVAAGDSLRRRLAPEGAAQSGGGPRIVLLGAADPGQGSQLHSPIDRGSLRGFGVDRSVSLGSPACGGRENLPLSLTVGAWLLAAEVGDRSEAVGFSVGDDFGSSRAALRLVELAETEPVFLLVMGDGSARRSAASPGYIDERAPAFDAVVESALRDGDAATLAELDLGLGRELLAAGVPAWRAAGRLLDGGRYSATMSYAADPFGVRYFVADWRTDG